MSTVTTRTPQQDRSRETRTKILETAVEVLATRGWQGATTSVVAARSGVSRGALQHHFPTREALFLTALEHMFEIQRGRVDTNVEPQDGEDRFDLLVTQILENYVSDEFKAALQIWTAAAAEPSLKERILPLEAKFARGIFDIAVEVLGADTSDERTRRVIQTTLDLARGLGLADLLSDDSERRAKVARFWAAELRTIKRIE